MEVADKVHGKSSLQYIRSLMTYSNILLAQGRLNQCYKNCLDSYELAKEVFGNENNIESSSILALMARVKTSLKEFEDAMNLIKKAKKNEITINSEYSNDFKMLTLIENNIKEEAKKHGIHFDQKKSFIAKIIPNTPLKLVIYSVGIATVVGILYATKKKSN